MNTERHMLDLLHARYSAVNPGNGPRYVCSEHVKNDAGFYAQRVCDLIVTDLWPSSGLAMHGHEVKVSRSDWLTEVKDPGKAAAFRPYLDYWWLVVSDPEIVRAGELPLGWGLMVVGSNGALRVKVKASRLGQPDLMPRGMRACLLRATAKTASRRQGQLPAGLQVVQAESEAESA